MFKAIIAAIAFILAACATTNDTGLFIPMPAKDGQSTVYVYRPSAMANAMYSPELYINDDFKRLVKNGENSRISLPTGKYDFMLKAVNNQSKLTKFSLDIKPGKTYFLRVSTALRLDNTAEYKPYFRSYSMEEISHEAAIKEISGCCIDNSNSKTKADPEEINSQTDDGFSVDKTQNPFSH